MPLVNDTELSRDIRNGEIANVYFFFGKDVSMIESYTKRLVKKLVPPDDQAMNYQSFDGKTLDLSAFSDCCEVYPMFAERVVVTVNDLNADALNAEDYKFFTQILSNLPETTTVIIYATGVDLYKNKTKLTDKNAKLMDFCSKNGVACDFAFKSISDMGKIVAQKVNKNGCTISKKASEYLVEKCGRDTILINSEIHKLCSYANGGEITSETIDLLCVRQLDADAFKLAANILRGKSSLAFTALNELYDMQSDSYSIVSALASSMTDIYRAVTAKSSGRSENDVLQDFAYPRTRSFAVSNAFRDSYNVPVKRVRKCLAVLAETDIQIKSLKTDNRLLVEEAMAKMLCMD